MLSLHENKGFDDVFVTLNLYENKTDSGVSNTDLVNCSAGLRTDSLRVYMVKKTFFFSFRKIGCTKESGRDLNPHGKSSILRAPFETGFSLSVITRRIQDSFT